jgi:hypothetical protein
MHPIRTGAQVRREACAGLVQGKSLLVHQREREKGKPIYIGIGTVVVIVVIVIVILLLRR